MEVNTVTMWQVFLSANIFDSRLEAVLVRGAAFEAPFFSTPGLAPLGRAEHYSLNQTTVHLVRLPSSLILAISFAAISFAVWTNSSRPARISWPKVTRVCVCCIYKITFAHFNRPSPSVSQIAASDPYKSKTAQRSSNPKSACQRCQLSNSH